MDTTQSINRTRYRDNIRPAVRFWTDINPNGSIGNTTMVSTTPGVGNYAEIQDVRGPSPFRMSKSARKVMRRLRNTKFRAMYPTRNDMGKYSVKYEASSDDLFIGLPNRQPLPGWGAVRIEGPIGPELFKLHSPSGWKPLGFNSVLSTTMERLIIAAFAKAKSPELLVGEFAGTLKQTIEMLKSPLKTSRQLLLQMLKKKNSWIKRGLTPAAAISAAWLEFRFGWRPLFLDIVKILEELDKKVLTFAFETKVARTKESITFSGEYNPGNTGLDGRYSFDRKLLYDIKGTVRAGVSYRVVVKGMEGYNSRFLGLRLRDVVTTAWELVPWSWLLDYFLHIGNFLEAGLPAPEVTIGDYWCSNKISYDYKGFYTFNLGYVPTGCKLDNAVPPFHRVQWTGHNRYVNPTLSWIPQPDLNGLSSIQALNLAAVVIAKAFKAVPAIAKA